MIHKLMCVILVLSMSSVNVFDDWPMFMHDLQHTGYTESFGPADENISWVHDFGSPLFLCDYPQVTKACCFSIVDDIGIFSVN